MSSSQHREEALFRVAVELAPGPARRVFLDQVCAGDADLRGRLEALLAAHGQPEEPSPAVAPAAKATIKLDFADAPDEAVGQTLGRYKLLERLGEGGCGVVYVAEQTEPVRRRVALKVIKLGMDTKAVVARFEAERQALAMMDHPNIAKVLDAGTTELGRPYFVMELVRGIRITDYCDQNQLSTAERLDLFIKICHAIQHAHQKGIIHRDIKPSNILVTLHDGVPVPKVIDFGIAKATEGRLTDATVYTQLHQFIGTPAYMSPEQAEMSGLDIDTRSDIYSLGVLLYELLAGSTPFDPKELMASGIDGMRKTIREKEPVRPSTRFATLKGEELTTTAKRRSADKAKLVHQLRGDLDWIVMKCLEKDRTRRYETANGLAADIKRHLNNEPVVARPPSKLYEFQKTVRRHKFGFAAAAALILVLSIGVLVSAWQAARATRAKLEALAARQQAVEAQANEARLREQAEAARSQAENLVTFMIQDLQPALNDYGRLPLLRQVDEKTVNYFSALPPELRSAKTELGRADAIAALSEILAAAGDAKSAREQGREALAIYRRLEEQHQAMPESAAGVLTLEWTDYQTDPAHSSAELDLYQQDILRRWRELYARFPGNVVVRSGFGGALWDRANFAAGRFNKPQEGIQLGLELQEHIRSGMAERPGDPHMAVAYANALGVLAIAYEATGQQDKAVRVSKEAETFYEQALKKDPGNLSLLADAADAARNLSYRVSSVSQKSSRDAELVARERYRLLTSLDPANVKWRYNYAMTHMMECYYLESQGQIEPTRQAFKKFDALLQNLALQPWDESKPADNSLTLARLAVAAGDVSDARLQIANAESRFQAQYDKLPTATFDRLQARTRWLNQESQVFWEMEDWAGLDRIARATLSVTDDGLAQRPRDSEMQLRRAVAQSFLGIALVGQDHAAEAIPLLEQAQEGFRAAPPVMGFVQNRTIYSAAATTALAEALSKTGNRERAVSLAESALSEWESALAREPDNWADKQSVASSSVFLAGLIDPAAPARQALLNRASAILAGPEAEGRLSMKDKAVLAKVESLRSLASNNPAK
ncbi:MAG: serine/threonine-protein kinase [Verrucomicrobiota bacterium]